MVEEHTERFAFVSIFYPIDGLVGDDVGSIAFFLYLFTIHLDERWIVVVSLSRKDFPIVESLWITYEVPFTNHGSLISILLEKFWESQLVAIESSGIVDESVGMAMLAGEHTGTAGATDGVGHEAVGEAHALVGYAVNIGRFNVTLVIGTDGLVRVVVAHDEENVHRLLGCRSLLFLVASCASGKACKGKGAQYGEVFVVCVLFHVVVVVKS